MTSDRSRDIRVTRLENDVESIYDILTGIDTRLDGIDTRLDGIDTRLDGIDTRLDEHTGRFDAIDTTLAEILLRLPEPS